MRVVPLSPEAAWAAKKGEIRAWVENEGRARMAQVELWPVRAAFRHLTAMLDADPPAGDEAVLLAALYDTLRHERYLAEPAGGRYGVEGQGESLRVRFTPGDVRAYLDERIEGLGARAQEGNALAGHYRDAVYLVRKAIFGGE